MKITDNKSSLFITSDTASGSPAAAATIMFQIITDETQIYSNPVETPIPIIGTLYLMYY